MKRAPKIVDAPLVDARIYRERLDRDGLVPSLDPYLRGGRDRALLLDQPQEEAAIARGASEPLLQMLRPQIGKLHETVVYDEAIARLAWREFVEEPKRDRFRCVLPTEAGVEVEPDADLEHAGEPVAGLKGNISVVESARRLGRPVELRKRAWLR